MLLRGDASAVSSRGRPTAAHRNANTRNIPSNYAPAKFPSLVSPCVFVFCAFGIQHSSAVLFYHFYFTPFENCFSVSHSAAQRLMKPANGILIVMMQFAFRRREKLMMIAVIEDC